MRLVLTSGPPGGAGDSGGEVERLLHLWAVGHQAAAAVEMVRVEGGATVSTVELPEIDNTSYLIEKNAGNKNGHFAISSVVEP